MNAMLDPKAIAQRYGGTASGNQVNIPTEGHGKHDRGTSITVDPSAPDGLLVHVHNGGDPLAVKDMLRRDGFLPERQTGSSKQRPMFAKAARRPGVSYFEYQDADGVTVCRKVRTDMADDKEFTWQHPDGKGGWKSGRGRDAILYRLPDLIAAPADAVIYLAEGERKADKLASWGLVATSSKDLPKDLSAFQGRTVAILPDNDPEGAKIARELCAALNDIADRVVLVELPGLPPKGDIMDWGGTVSELEELTVKALATESDDTWPVLDLAACAARKAPPRQWVIEGWAPANKATLLAGDGGVGKSLLAQIQATCVAIGRPFMGLKTRQASAAYLSWEDDADELWRRQESICEVLSITMASLDGRLHLVSYTEEENPFLATADDKGLRVTALGRKIERLVDRHGIGLLILDNASQIAGIDHNAVDEVAPFAHWLGTLATRRNGAVILLHHTNKAGQDFLGSVAYNNQFRSRMLLARPEDGHDPDLRQLTNPKANYAQAGNSIEIRWHNGAFIRDEDLPADTRAEIAEISKANGENAAFLRCLAQRTKERRHVSEKVGANYAPKLFATMPEAKGIKKDRLVAAMDRLFRIGAIERGFLWRDTAEGKDIYGLRETGNVTGNRPETRSANDRKPTENDRKIHPLYTTYISGAALGPAAPSDESDDLDWGADDVEAD